MFDAIEALERIRRSCDARKPIPEDIQAWLGGALGRFLDHSSPDLNEAFGLTQGRGGVPWWLAKGIAERDTALRSLAAIHYAGQTPSYTARRIRQMAIRYESVAWSRDAKAEAMPCRYRGTAREWLWRAFNSGARMPLSERHLRNLLATPPLPRERHISTQLGRPVGPAFNKSSQAFAVTHNGGLTNG